MLASLMGRDTSNGRTFAFSGDLEKKISTLTAQDINAAIRKHWDAKKLVILRAGDFKKK